MNSVRHINIMHGEKLFHILDSFFSFHKCYVWDEHYLKVFQKLHAAKEQFIVEQPPFFYELKQLSCNKGHGFKYFLDGTESINEILNITKQVKSKFNDLILRAHPLHTDCKRLENFKINFENPHLVAINDSIKNSEYVCAKCSTVLYKGYLMGKKVVIDDMTDPLLFNQLIDMDYIMFSKEYIKLSDLLSLSVN